ncbi:MAG: ABC transporter ATP-binding protein [SAR86 cluster bacterium]|jgi:ABC-type microcin C transport system duplicated ATPase subunit YejF|nr:MAG: ABC transporter ATP-binding protein [SAR86 cluster bacterium]|tara:strand:- start:5462 stop:7045 length:1584 start_codon:yes stop_codon:yes gene_type:complete
MSKLLEIKNLSVDFKLRENIFRAVDNISFEIDKNQTLALVGESGSGKSVTAMSILKLLPYPKAMHPKNSKIIFEGKNILEFDNKSLRQVRGNIVTMIFQEPMTSLNPFHRVGDQIIEAIITHSKTSKKEAKNKAFELLELVEIPDLSRRFKSFPHELSGGQRQRVMIAMALVNNPKLLIADEPTTALDVTIQAQILDLMSKLQKELGMSILFITHDLGLVDKFSDKVAVMKEGKIVEIGETKKVFTNPKEEYTKLLLASIPQEKTTIKSEPKPLVEISDLDVFYRIESQNIFKENYFHAVKNVNLKINKKTTIGLVGESGSGKSTLGRAIANLLPYKGSVIFDGKEISSINDRSIRKDIQIIFQDPYGSLSPRLTVGDIIGEGLDIHMNLSKKERNDLIEQTMKEVELDPKYRFKYPHEFSGGQRQRIAIARSIILKPKFIILDEPTSALDRSIQIQIIDLLKSLQEKYSLTYLFISHDLKVIRAMSDRILVMQNGEMVEEGNAKSIFEKPKEEYTRELLSAAIKYS